MILYHRTTRERAEAIERGGFKDAVGTYFTDQEFSGVWVSNVPLEANDGAWGEVLFQITLDLAEPEIADYEWVEEGKRYREWLMPAALLNAHARLREISQEDGISGGFHHLNVLG